MARDRKSDRSTSRRAFIAGVAGLPGTMLPGFAQTAAPAATPTVDLQLVLATDASGSVSQRRFVLQRQGYADAFRNRRVIRAIRSGLAGSIAVTMVQWTGPQLHVLSLPWFRAHDDASISELADRIEKSPRALFGGGTSISGAIDYSVGLFRDCPWRSARKVIDVSGDGANSSGRLASEARDDALKQGIVINGLPILAFELDLDRHYQEEVIGGPGAFMIAARDFESFGDAIQRKLVQEISGLPAGARHG